MENTERKPQSKMRIYEDRTQLSEFVEPQWIEKFKKLIALGLIENYKNQGCQQ